VIAECDLIFLLTTVSECLFSILRRPNCAQQPEGQRIIQKASSLDRHSQDFLTAGFDAQAKGNSKTAIAWNYEGDFWLQGARALDPWRPRFIPGHSVSLRDTALKPCLSGANRIKLNMRIRATGAQYSIIKKNLFIRH
jgi:hypothetical protein